MPEKTQIFTEESCLVSKRILFNLDLVGPYWGHVWAIFGPGFRYFKFFLTEMDQNDTKFHKYTLMITYWDHIGAMFWPN